MILFKELILRMSKVKNISTSLINIFLLINWKKESMFHIFKHSILEEEFITEPDKKTLKDLYISVKKIMNRLNSIARLYKYKKAVKYDIDTDLHLNPLEQLTNNEKISIIENNTIYNFKLRDLISCWKLALLNSQGLFAKPIELKNPYTNLPFKKHNLYLIQDAAHSWGISYNDKFVGNIADITTVSFHPVKNMTTCEGGMIFTDNTELYNKMKLFRSHGISTDFTEREKTGQLYSPMVTLGYHYRICDLLCALGINQLKKLSTWIQKRNDIAEMYKIKINELNNKLGNIVEYLDNNTSNAYHIFVIKLDLNKITCTREEFFKAMKSEGIGVNIHYLPIYKHPFYQSFLDVKPCLPVCDKIYESIITLPLYPLMNQKDIDDVIISLYKVTNFYKKII